MDVKEEKRKYKRVKNEFDVTIEKEDPKWVIPVVEVGKSIDVSACGVLFKYDKSLEMGSLVRISFLKPNSFDFFRGNARVVRIEMNPDNISYEVGVEFLNLSKNEEDKLNYYLIKEESK